MKKDESKQRIFDVRAFYHHLKNMMESLKDLVVYRMSGNMDKAFAEKIMLAVTEVNGCRYCNYLHTGLALKAGVSKEDIRMLLNGQFENISSHEAHAIVFAQHYADTGGRPDSKTYQTFIKFYGEDKAKGIMSIIKAIMVGNIYGLSLDAVISRIKRKPLPGSKLKDEVFITVGIIVLVPLIGTQILLQKLTKRSGK